LLLMRLLNFMSLALLRQLGEPLLLLERRLIVLHQSLVSRWVLDPEGFHVLRAADVGEFSLIGRCELLKVVQPSYFGEGQSLDSFDALAFSGETLVCLGCLLGSNTLLGGDPRFNFLICGALQLLLLRCLLFGRCRKRCGLLLRDRFPPIPDFFSGFTDRERIVRGEIMVTEWLDEISLVV
jgi:hypothetical protein